MKTNSSSDAQIEEMEKMLKVYESVAPDDTRTKLLRAMIETAEPVECVRAVDVLDDYVIDYIKHGLRPLKHQCWRNATLLADDIGGIDYVEGLLWTPVMLDHAFNCVDGYYIDITAEFVLGEDPEKLTYTKIGIFDAGERRRAQMATGLYGKVFEFLNS